MKAASWMLLVALGPSLQAEPRNPFLMPVSPCEALLKRLDGWQLRGVVYQSRPAESVALMKFSGQRWQRVKAGQFLEQNGQVTAVLERQMRVSLTGACEGSYYHWEIQGGVDDKAYYGRRADADAPGGVDE